MKIVVVALCAVSMSLPVFAQESSSTVRSILEPLPPGHHVFDASQLAKNQRDMLGKGTTKRSDYLIVEVAPEYLDQLSYINVESWLETRPGDAGIVANGQKLLGRFKEGPHRLNLIFGEGGKPSAMFTIWKLLADGVTAVTVRDNENQRIGSIPATLSLATAASRKDCMWKVIAVENGVLYEFVIKDSLSGDGAPRLRPANVISIVTHLVESSKNGVVEE